MRFTFEAKVWSFRLVLVWGLLKSSALRTIYAASEESRCFLSWRLKRSAKTQVELIKQTCPSRSRLWLQDLLMERGHRSHELLPLITFSLLFIFTFSRDWVKIKYSMCTSMWESFDQFLIIIWTAGGWGVGEKRVRRNLFPNTSQWRKKNAFIYKCFIMWLLSHRAHSQVQL